MVSLGTILTIGIIGGVSALGYAVYRNSDAIGGALSRGVEKNLTNPIGNYFDNLFADTPTNVKSADPSIPPGDTRPIDPIKGLLNPLPSATAQTPGTAEKISNEYANNLEKKYLPGAIESVEKLGTFLSPGAYETFYNKAKTVSETSQTPNLTMAQSIVDQTRLSAGGSDPFTNKFYKLTDLKGNELMGGKVLPLSREAVQSYASKKIIAREVYL